MKLPLPAIALIVAAACGVTPVYGKEEVGDVADEENKLTHEAAGTATGGWPPPPDAAAKAKSLQEILARQQRYQAHLEEYKRLMTKPNTSISDDILAKGRREVTVFGPSHNTKTRVTVTLDREGLTEGEFEEAKRIASGDSALNQSFEAPGYGTEDVLGIAAGVVGLLIIVWFAARSFLTFSRIFFRKYEDFKKTRWTPTWVKEQMQLSEQVQRGRRHGIMEELEFSRAYKAYDSWYNCLRATLRAGVRWRELTGKKDPDGRMDQILDDFGQEIPDKNEEDEDVQARNAWKLKFEGTDATEFLRPCKEATIFLHRKGNRILGFLVDWYRLGTMKVKYFHRLLPPCCANKLAPVGKDFRLLMAAADLWFPELADYEVDISMNNNTFVDLFENSTRRDYKALRSVLRRKAIENGLKNDPPLEAIDNYSDPGFGRSEVWDQMRSLLPLMCHSNLDWLFLRQPQMFSLHSWKIEEWELTFGRLHCLPHAGQQEEESKDQVTIQQLRWRNQSRFGHKELDAVLRDLSRDPPRYEVTLSHSSDGKLYFF